MLFSLHLPFHIHIGVVPLSICHSLHFSTEGILILITPSPLSSPIPHLHWSVPQQSLSDLSSRSVLGESNSLLRSLQHPSLPSPLSFHHFQHLCLCVCTCVCASVLNCTTDIITGKEFLQATMSFQLIFFPLQQHTYTVLVISLRTE